MTLLSRAGVLAGMAALASLSAAESYLAKVHVIPSDAYVMFTIVGAGDNAMMCGYLTEPNGKTHAAYRTPGAYRNLHPAFFTRSELTDSVGGTYHVGFGTVIGGAERALFWVGGDQATQLHPTGGEYESSEAHGVGGQLQVGLVRTSVPCATCGIGGGSDGTPHAVVWSRTAASMKRLHAPSAVYSQCRALSTNGTQIAGHGLHIATNQTHALTWSGPNTYAVDIHPAGYTQSEAWSTWGNQQAGFISGPATGNQRHAALWSGTAQSVVDLNPNATFLNSYVENVRGTLQVGAARAHTTPNRLQAIAWHGSAATWINLHFKLPMQYWTWHSVASDVDNMGNITGYVQHPTEQTRLPLVWHRQP